VYQKILIGDSTTKLIDKRQVLTNEIISKCRADTLTEAYKKISRQSPHKMQKIIYCVGLNDLRNGQTVDQIEENMRSLIEESPSCYIYICSILPVHSGEVSRDQISRLNLRLESLQKSWERVFYINTYFVFQNHDAPWSLFERDRLHPNIQGAQILMNTLRRKLHVNPTFHQFTSKRATPRTSDHLYAERATTDPRSQSSTQRTWQNPESDPWPDSNKDKSQLQGNRLPNVPAPHEHKTLAAAEHPPGYPYGYPVGPMRPPFNYPWWPSFYPQMTMPPMTVFSQDTSNSLQNKRLY
jgi:lysophospholipase L1-like esterase